MNRSVVLSRRDCVCGVVAIASLAGASPAQVFQWPASSGGNGHCYEVVFSTKTWTNANADAIARGGYLASVTSEAENQFVYRLVAGDPRFWTFERFAQTGATYYHGPWLGASQPIECPVVSPACGWVWSSGEAWNYTNWLSGEPNDLIAPTENSLQFFGFSGPSSGWNDRPNSRPSQPVTAYIVEFAPQTGSVAQAVYNIGYGDTCLGSLPSSMSWFSGGPWLNLRYPGEDYTNNGIVHEGGLDVAVLGSGKPAGNSGGVIGPRTLYFGDFCIGRAGLCNNPVFLPAATAELGSVQVQDLDWVFDFGAGSYPAWQCGGSPSSTPGGLRMLGTPTTCGAPFIIGGTTSETHVPGQASLTLRGTGTLETTGTIVGETTGSTGSLVLDAAGIGATTGPTFKTGTFWIGLAGAGDFAANAKAAVQTTGARIGIGAPATVLLNGATWTDSAKVGGGTIIGAGNSGMLMLTGASAMTVTPANPLTLALETGSSGDLTIEGASTLATTAAPTIVGDRGTGSVTLRGGGQLTSGLLTLGRLAGASGRVDVSGTGTKLTAAGAVIGGIGPGTLTISAADIATISANLFVGQNALGQLSITGSQLNMGAGTVVGRYNDTLGRGDGRINLGSAAKMQGVQWVVGDAGDGRIDAAGGSSINGSDLIVGLGATATGAIALNASTATFSNFVSLGGNTTVAGGTATVTLVAGSKLFAARGLNLWPGATLEFAGDGGSVLVGTTSSPPNGRLDVNSGLILNHGGTIKGNVRVSGTASPGVSTVGVGAITGSLTFQNNAQCGINIGSLQGVVEADRFNVSGAVNLGGALVVTVNSGVKVPASFQKTVISGASRSGTFSTITLPPGFRVAYGAAPDLVKLSYCRADFDNDGFLSFEDFDAFIAALEAGSASADFNDDGFLTFEDFDAFIQTFEAGC